MRLRDTIPGIASGFAIVFTALAAVAQPEVEMSVSQYAAEYRHVGIATQSPHPGPWQNERAPYLVEIMDACQVGNGVSRVAITGAAQFGKSESPLNAIFHLIEFHPRGVMVLLPALDEAKTWSRLKWEPNVEESPRIRRNVFHRKSRSSEGSTTMVKQFRGGSVELATAGTSAGLQMRTIGYLLAEECDQYGSELGKARGVGGDPIDAAEVRMMTVADAKTVLCSTPGFAGKSRITREYNASDMRRWHTPCPHCGDFHVLDFKTMALNSEGRPVFHCPSCGVEIEEGSKRSMNAAGRWVPTFEHDESEPEARAANPAPPKVIPADEIDRWASRNCGDRFPGFWMWQAQSNLSEWLHIWRKWEKVQAGTGDPIEFSQKFLGEPYEEIVERPDHVKLYEARGLIYPEAGPVPEWASIVTGFADVQINRIEWDVYAFGKGGVWARIANGVIPKNPLDWTTWQVDMAAIVDQTFSGPAYRARKADLWGIDSGGNSTSNVYNFCLPRQFQAQPVLACKGSSHDKGDAAAFAKGNRVPVYWRRRKVGTVNIWLTGTHQLKSRVFLGLSQGILSAETGQLEPRSLHYPRTTTQEDFKQLTAEYLKREDQRDRGTWEKVSAGAANERLDCAVGCLALAINEGLDRLDEDGWAARAAERMPDLIARELTPIERLARGIAPEQPAGPSLTPPPAEGRKSSLNAAALQKLREQGRRAKGG